MLNSVKVTFEPEGKSVFVLPGTSVFEAAARAGVILSTPCGGKGKCGKCVVEILHDPPAASEIERKLLTPEQLAAGCRLACQTRLSTDVVVNVPLETRFFEQKILVEGASRDVKVSPNIQKRFLRLPEPSLEDPSADADRLLSVLAQHGVHAAPTLRVSRMLPRILREHSFALTAVIGDGQLIAVEGGDTSEKTYGVAFDIGTTTVVGMLVDLRTGERKATASLTNPQVAFGDDVVSRINHAHENPDGLRALQARIVRCMNDLIHELCANGPVKCNNIYEIAVVGNTTMNHLLFRIDPTYIAQAPYVAAVRSGMTASAAELGLTINPCGMVYAMPNIAGFVGGDTVGVILATDIFRAKGVRLAIDIGTNGEMALGSRERLLACSTAAGPAFEGARIQQGMRATAGAIEKVLINDDVRINVIGGQPARGICGTGLIDAVAELLRLGVVDSTGRVQAPDALGGSVPDSVRRRVVSGQAGFDFILALPEESHEGKPVVLSQKDIREVQLAKGAIAAGVRILLRELGVEQDDVEEILLAGAFGNFIRRSMAKRIGLLPDVPTDRIRFVGNAAGAGARLALMSQECRQQAEEISQRTEYVELAGRADFQMEFAEAMLFPEPK